MLREIFHDKNKLSFDEMMMIMKRMLCIRSTCSGKEVAL